MPVDPDNRLVADVLEAEWNAKLRAHGVAAERYEANLASACAIVLRMNHQGALTTGSGGDDPGVPKSAVP
jgi:hypothetical protein